MGLKEYYSVTEVNVYAKELLESCVFFNDISIKGEITNLKKHYTGHWYFTLKDDSSCIKCTMFKSANMIVDFDVDDGMQVIVKGNVTLYEKDGTYQINCKSMKQDGIGDIYKAFEELKQKLEKEGLFNAEYKKELPYLPKRVGVITSKTGAVIRDIINVSTRRYENVNLLIYPAAVQGRDCPSTVASGVQYFNEKKNVDVIIIARGGGSFEDLNGFNDEYLARKIFESKIPIISAVGHETDFTICDFVSDKRVPTPSAAAEICYPVQAEILLRIKALRKELVSYMLGTLNDKKRILEKYKERKLDKIPLELMKKKQEKLERYKKQLCQCIIQRLEKCKVELKNQIMLLDSYSPLKTLERGYAAVLSQDNKIIKSVSNVKNGDKISIRLKDGSINAVVK